MTWVTKTLDSTLGKKLLMALTGLFLILFLVVHLAGNLQLLIPDNGEAFNNYAHAMATNPFIKVVSIGNFAFILIHVIYSILLTRQNKVARPVEYAMSKSNTNSTWASRNMGVLGFVIFIFLLIHLRGFWYEFKFGSLPYMEGTDIKDVFSIVNEAYSNIIYVVIYVVSMGFLGFHLSHGFASAFQTLGLNHVKYSPLIKKVGAGFSFIVPFLFAIIPIVMYIKSLG